MTTVVPQHETLYPDTFRVIDPERQVRDLKGKLGPLVEATRYVRERDDGSRTTYVSVTWQTHKNGLQLFPHLGHLREMRTRSIWCHTTDIAFRDGKDRRRDGDGFGGWRIAWSDVAGVLLNPPRDLHAITFNRLYETNTSLPNSGERYDLLPSKLEPGTWDICVSVPSSEASRLAEIYDFILETSRPDVSFFKRIKDRFSGKREEQGDAVAMTRQLEYSLN